VPTPLSARLITLIHDVEEGRRGQDWATLDLLAAAHEVAIREGTAA
jgi:hypothetical protein